MRVIAFRKKEYLLTTCRLETENPEGKKRNKFLYFDSLLKQFSVKSMKHYFQINSLRHKKLFTEIFYDEKKGRRKEGEVFSGKK